MQAIILAAGKSQRFYPFNFQAHKSMTIIMGKTLLEHTLLSLEGAGISEVVIVVGENSTIPQELQDIQVKKLSITYVTQDDALGMGHALLQAKQYLQERFFLLSAYHLEFSDFKKEMEKKQTDAQVVVLLAKKDTRQDKFGMLEVTGDVVTDVVEKVHDVAHEGLRLISMYLLNKSFLQTLEKIPVEQYHFEKALAAYAKTGNVRVVEATNPTVTLKQWWGLLDMKDYFLSHLKSYTGKHVAVAKNATITGTVYMSDGVKIMEGACIKGPCYLGKNVIVGNNAIVRGGVIAEENVVIGATMEVKNSLLMRDVTTHTGFIGDSIVGPFSRLAAGFCTANVRFDRRSITSIVREKKVDTGKVHLGFVCGERVDTGINVSVMPGVIIGSNVTIGPGTAVMENMEENTLLYTEYKTVVKKKSPKTV